MIKNIKLRLNLDKADDRQAYDLLRHSEKSMSKFVIAAVNAYGGYLSAQEREEYYLQQVKDSLRQTLQEMFGTALMEATPVQKPCSSAKTAPELAEESGEIADDFLENVI